MELQDAPPEFPIPVERVGFRGLRKRVLVRSPEGPVALDVTMDLFVDISQDRKGAHLSRNVDAASLMGETSIPDESWSLEALADSVHAELLRRHSYSTSALVRLRTTLWSRVVHEGLESLEPVDVEIVVRGSPSAKEYATSVTVTGMTVCPSAESTIKAMLGYEGLAPSHNQKVRLRGTVMTRKLVVIRADEIASQLWQSLSAPSLTLLKREQEARLVLSAFSRPKFAEDSVREAVTRMGCAFRGRLPPDAVLIAEIESFESIHPQNVYARARASLAEIPQSSCEKLKV